MRKNTVIILLTVFALALAPAVGLACDKEKSGCPHEKAAKLTALADHAEKGCEKSQAKLVAMAKDSGCEKTAALAAKAEAGDEKHGERAEDQESLHGYILRFGYR